MALASGAAWVSAGKDQAKTFPGAVRAEDGAGAMVVVSGPSATSAAQTGACRATGTGARAARLRTARVAQLGPAQVARPKLGRSRDRRSASELLGAKLTSLSHHPMQPKPTKKHRKRNRNFQNLAPNGGSFNHSESIRCTPLPQN